MKTLSHIVIIFLAIFYLSTGFYTGLFASELVEGDEDPLVPTETAPEDKATEEPLACGPGVMLPLKLCQKGESPLCVDTPPGGVAADEVIIHGFVDREAFTLSTLTLYAQHDYTKALTQLGSEEAISADCSTFSPSEQKPFCLNHSGEFSALVRLPELGPYTIIVQATFAMGEPVQQLSHVSRVMPVMVTSDDITLTPSPEAGMISSDYVQVRANLTSDCTNCDFVGASTGGVTLSVQNVIQHPELGVKLVKRETNVASGGVLTLCMPIGGGKNTLSISLCNVANRGEHCPTVADITFSSEKEEGAFKLISPEDGATYSAKTHSSIPLEFVLPDIKCHLNPVTLTWNDSSPKSLCPIDGVFKEELSPLDGINVGVIRIEYPEGVREHSFTIGWGDVVSPFTKSGEVKEKGLRWEKNSVMTQLSAHFIENDLPKLINQFLSPKNLPVLLEELMTSFNASPKSPTAEEQKKRKELDAIKKSFPFCSDGSNEFEGVQIRLVGKPKIGSFSILGMHLEADTIQPEIHLKDLVVRIQLFRDDNYDGKADDTIVPLKLAFKRLYLSPKIVLNKGSKPTLLLTADTTDCSFLKSDYCQKKPAILTPQNIIGNATPGGAFIICDSAGQQMDAGTAKKCESMNLVNAQTGLVAKTILSTLNDKLYCDGSAMLTHSLRNLKFSDRVNVGCQPKGEKHGQTPILSLWECDSGGPSWLNGRSLSIPLGIDAGADKIKISKSGIAIRAATQAGSADFFSKLEGMESLTGSGYIVRPESMPVPSLTDWMPDGLSFGASEVLFNQLLYLLTASQSYGNSLLDWDIDELFFEKSGFNFSAMCDAPIGDDVERSSLCDLRPRVKELLGTPLVSAGYFSPNQPLRIRVRANRKLAPHVRFYYDEKKPYVGLQIPNLDLYFYALKADFNVLDGYGHPKVIQDSVGAVVDSMNPNSINPDEGYIFRAQMTLSLPIELGELESDPENPSQFRIVIRPDSQNAKIVITAIDYENRTIVPADSLVSLLKSKLLIGLDKIATAENAPKITIPKEISPLSTSGVANLEGDLFKKLGLETLQFDENGLKMGIPISEGYFLIGANPAF